ncbi:MAG: GAF domain-containing protein [Alphaproteobacteria bacterium]|nr:GAF domain-containing protein [Alphaproteobacteria bacterium]
MDSLNKDALLDRVLAISHAIAGQLDYQSVLRQVAGEIYELFEFDHVDVAIINPSGIDFTVYEVGMETEWGRNIKGNHTIVNSPVRSVLLGELPFLLTDDALIDERFHFEGAFDSPIFEAALHSRIIVPLHAHGSLLGTLNISNKQKQKYNQTDVTVANYIADLLATYFFAVSQGEEAKAAVIAENQALNRENMLRIGALRLTEGMEQERKRIGMDLHDQTLADLTRTVRHISRLRRREEVNVHDLALLEDEIDTCLKELRNIIEDTKPGVLELFGLSQAIEAQLLRAVAGIRPSISIGVIDKTEAYLDAADESLQTTIFRIVQEAINNAVKHSRPTYLKVEMSKTETGARIEIMDDGAGIDNDADMTSGGLGNMNVRAALISAEISFLPVKAGGTHVVLDIPFEAVVQ